MDELPFDPDWVSAPGDTMQRVLEERSIPMDVFVARTGDDEALARRLLSGDEPITEELAASLATLLGGSQSFWMRREQHYRDGLARGLHRVRVTDRSGRS